MLRQISNAAGFEARTASKKPEVSIEPTSAPTAPQAKFEVRGRRKRELTGRNYTFSVRLRPQDAQRIYDLVDEMGTRTVADVVEAALSALEEKIRTEKQDG